MEFRHRTSRDGYAAVATDMSRTPNELFLVGLLEFRAVARDPQQASTAAGPSSSACSGQGAKGQMPFLPAPVEGRPAHQAARDLSLMADERLTRLADDVRLRREGRRAKQKARTMTENLMAPTDQADAQ